MKRLLGGIGGVLLGVLLLTLGVVRWVGLEPRDNTPGLWVSGELVTTPVADWSFSERFTEIFIETRTWYFVPHSITGYCAVNDGHLYLISAYYQGGRFPEGKYWNLNVARDPRVRLKIGDRLFPAQLRLITDPAMRESVHQSFQKKYPDWESPGLANVYFLRVETTG